MSEEIMNIGSEEGDQVLELDINRLRTFKNHPFKVTADMSMVELKDSIEKYGILNPLIVRPVPEGYYEIISGHRRKFAAKQLGYTKVPVIIKVMKNDEAIVAMVDSNLQREYISPSEKAHAYKMRYDVMKKKGNTNIRGRVVHKTKGKRTVEILAEEFGESIKQIQRYLKLTELAMYLQTNELKNKNAFEKILPVMKKAAADIIVFPEYCYVPFEGKMTNKDIALIEDQDDIFAHCLELSKQIGKAVIVSSHDKYDTIFSVFANANPLPGETDLNLYIKHTMCGSSCLEFEQYPEIAGDIFNPILYKGYLIGMTICYDCNHALFSRMYGIYGIDLIINSTGGNVIYDKWFKYNKVRAIENNCYTGNVAETG